MSCGQGLERAKTARALVVDVHDGVAAKERHGDLELLVFLVDLDDGAREVLKGTGQEGDLAAAAPALIFSSFSDRALDRILDELNESGLAHGILRAVTTPHNRSWTLGKLLGELETERKAMQAVRQPVKEDSADD